MTMPVTVASGGMKEILNRFLYFTGMGAVGTVVHYLVLMGLVELSGTGPVIASAFAFSAGALVNYHLNYRITFRSNKSHREAMTKFFIVAVVGLLMNTAIMAVATEVLSIHYLITQVIATGMVLLWNFTGNLLWTFRKDNDHGP